jgi:hypothetical protein
MLISPSRSGQPMPVPNTPRAASITAARRIIEIEDYPVLYIFLEMHVSTTAASDEEAFGHLEHTGRPALYVVKRVVQ